MEGAHASPDPRTRYRSIAAGPRGRGAPSVAWAAPNDVAQPTYATVGLPYSFQISDTVLGTPVKAWYSALPSGDCGPAGDVWGLPSGLTMSSTGLISGTPTVVEQAAFCGEFVFANGVLEEVPMIITVGTGNATLDATVVPAGTAAARYLEDATTPCSPRVPGCLFIRSL